MEKRCIVCDVVIPEGRVRVLPNTKTCVEHSSASPYGIRTVAYGTTADDAQQEFEIIRDPELVRKLEEYAKIKITD
jgi:RNA polymerase-binding transcription factor DksA